MVGLGESDDEILEILRDLRANDVEMLTIGQYLAPSSHHLPVARYVHPEVFKMYEREALAKMCIRDRCGPGGVSTAASTHPCAPAQGQRPALPRRPSPLPRQAPQKLSLIHI